MLEWNKGRESETISKVDYIQGMEKEMDNICDMLSVATFEFDAKDFFEKINGYINQNDRLLYTHITNYIFVLDEEDFVTLQTNMDNVVNYMYGEECQKDFSQQVKDKYKKRNFERTQRTVLKMWDHVNLARKQYVMFHHKDKDYTKIVDEKMEYAEAKISKEMNVQLISLVAIFTALSFLVFGGISSLDNIFIGAKDIPITKLMIVGIIWCFCIMNLIFVFLFFIAKITKLDIKSTDDINANLVQKYPLVWWSNLFLISLLMLCCWSYYVKKENISNTIYSILVEHSELFVICGTILIIGIIIVLAIILVCLTKKNGRKKKKIKGHPSGCFSNT